MIVCGCLIQQLKVFRILRHLRDTHDLLSCFNNWIPIYFKILTLSLPLHTRTIYFINFIEPLFINLAQPKLGLGNIGTKLPNITKLRILGLKRLLNQRPLPHHFLGLLTIIALLSTIFQPWNPLEFDSSGNPWISFKSWGL